jgi:TRAP-type transport system periplasmic protein
MSFIRPLLCAMLVTGGTAHAQTMLDMSNEYELHSIHGAGDQFFADRVSALSEGDVVITLHAGASLGFRSADHLDAVSDGVVPLANTLGTVLAGSDPTFLVSSLPFIASNASEARALYDAARPNYETFFEQNGQILLYASPWPPSGIWGETAIDSVSAITDLRIRTYDANGTRTLIEAGASPIQLSWADVVPQLATGGIDAVLTSAEGGSSAQFWEHLPVFTEINYAMPLNFVHMNRDVFNGLDAASQEAIMNAAAEADVHNWQALQNRVAQNYAIMREHEMTIVTEIESALREELSRAATVIINDWRGLSGERGAEILRAYSEATGRNF